MERLHELFEKYVNGKSFNLDITVCEDGRYSTFITSYDNYDDLNDFIYYISGILAIPYRYEGEDRVNVTLTSGNYQERIDDLLRGTVETMYSTGRLPSVSQKVLISSDNPDFDDKYEELIDDPDLLKCVGAALSHNMIDLFIPVEETLFVLHNPPRHFRNGLSEYERMVKQKFVHIRE